MATLRFEKALENLQAAELCHNHCLYNSSVSRSYYAMFLAVWEAIEYVTKTPTESWQHQGLWTAFNYEVHYKRGLCPANFYRYLIRAYDARRRADYLLDTITKIESEEIFANAKEMIEKIKEVINYV